MMLYCYSSDLQQQLPQKTEINHGHVPVLHVDMLTVAFRDDLYL